MLFCLGSQQLTQAVEHTAKIYDDIGEMIAEQVCKRPHRSNLAAFHLACNR